MITIGNNTKLNKDVVGLEELPNIFIDNIKIYDIARSIEGRMKVEWDIVSYLCLDTMGKIKNEKFYREGLVHLYISTNANDTEYLINNKSDFDSVEQVKYIQNSSVQKKIISFSNIKNYKKYLEYNEMTQLKMSTEIKLNKTDHLTVFAFCVMPNEFNSNNSTVKGPIVAEKIILKGLVNYSSTILTTEDNSYLWPGPVHKHTSGQFMANSFHNEMNHPLLREHDVLNLKIKDFRELPIDLPDPSMFKQRREKNKNMFSKIEYSQLDNNRMGFLFTMNLKNILLNSSKEAQILRRVNQEIFNNIANTIKIEEIKIYSKINNKSRFDLLFSTHDGDNGIPNIRSEDKSLQEVFLFKNPQIRTISGAVRTKNIKYLKVEVKVSNPAKKYLEELFRSSVEVLSEYKNYLSILKSSNFYSRHKRSFKRKALVSSFDNQGEVWLKAINKYINLIYFFKNNEESINFDSLAYSLMSKISPRSCTPESLDLFFRDYQKIIMKFKSIFDLKNSSFNSNNSFRRRNPRSSGRLRIQNDAAKLYTINYKGENKTKDYYTSRNLTIPIYRKSNFLKRLEIELSKMSIDSTDNEENQFAYLSPSVLQNADDRFRFTSLSSLDNDMLKKFEDSLEISDKRLSSLFGTNIRAVVFEEPIDNFNFDNLGIDTNFSSDETAENEKIVDKKISNLIGNVSKNLNNDNKKLVTSIEKNMTETDMPPHHMALIDSDSIQNTIGNVNDFFQTKQHSRDLCFFNLKKVMFYKFAAINNEIDLNNIKLINLSIGEISSERAPLFCKIIDYYNPNFKVSNNKFEDYKTINEFFIIYPDEYQLNKNFRINRLPHENLFRDTFTNYKAFDFYETEFMRTCLNEQPESRKELALKRFKKSNKKINPEVEREAKRLINETKPKDYEKMKEMMEKEALEKMIEKTILPTSRELNKEEIKSTLTPKEPNVKPFSISTENKIEEAQTSSPNNNRRQRRSRSNTRQRSSRTRNNRQQTPTSSPRRTTTTRSTRGGY